MANRTCICTACGAEFPRPGSRGVIPKYCSEDCKPRCSIEGCTNPTRKRGWCGSHYAQWLRTGTVQTTIIKWATEYVCVVCGVDTEPGSGRRKHCSLSCQAADSRHKGKRPKHATCRLCGRDFHLGRRNGRLQPTDTVWCPDCGRDSPEAQRLRRYGITPEQYDAALEAGCPICLRKVDTLQVDHDHDCCPGGTSRLCGKCTRGMICGACNRALGLFRDDVQALVRAQQYLSA